MKFKNHRIEERIPRERFHIQLSVFSQHHLVFAEPWYPVESSGMAGFPSSCGK